MIVSGGVGAWPPEAGSWDLLVNCTPIGMHPKIEETPIDRELLTAFQVRLASRNGPSGKKLSLATRNLFGSAVRGENFRNSGSN